jgi:putative endonuclease
LKSSNTSSTSKISRTTKSKGDIAEKSAISFLQNLGFEIVEQNFYAKKLGEIDIIAIKDEVYRFIEVKSSSKIDDFEPIYNITPSKIRKVINSAQYYMKLKKLNVAYCIDAVIVKDRECELLENITF